ncbi:hypothetical protein NC661_00785 [Aquibacillus koreensis]|uniref:Uncharacterized protein n=1 Tax=Aquibacillus koreensis TaxID=279446 RepID=A0A9X3WI54_9BACI|nr:hypothetical protein [Aquibacillus koreensis]MCT2537474.1 hypothetical protein [Aquibacillus koreensis]MDC3418920.1 hypothetical protein [Aquibacillus koreensis]
MNKDSYFLNKKKASNGDVLRIEHQITYPGQEEFNLRNVSFSLGENKYFTTNMEENDSNEA